MIVLGIVLIVVGYLVGISLLTTLGIILLVVGLILFVLGGIGHSVGGRNWW